jgi:hypothetical protein
MAKGTTTGRENEMTTSETIALLGEVACIEALEHHLEGNGANTVGCGMESLIVDALDTGWELEHHELTIWGDRAIDAGRYLVRCEKYS